MKGTRHAIQRYKERYGGDIPSHLMDTLMLLVKEGYAKTRKVYNMSEKADAVFRSTAVLNGRLYKFIHTEHKIITFLPLGEQSITRPRRETDQSFNQSVSV